MLRSLPDGTRISLGEVAEIRDGFVEEEAFGDLVHAVGCGGQIEVLDDTGEVAEADIDESHVVLRNVVDEFFSRREHLGLLVRRVVGGP